jgi:alkylhydroperoxidase family enzyme
MAFDKTLTEQVLDDFESANIDARLSATLRFLRKMTLDPQALTPDDAKAVLATGVEREALTQAIHVAYLFNVYDRLADSMGWHVPDKALGSYHAGALRLLKRGYQ